MTTYVFMDIGCRECGAPSELVMVSDDLDAIKAKWDEVTVERRDGIGRRPRPARFEVRNPDYGNEWPDNVIALDGGGSYAWVVYEVQPIPREDPVFFQPKAYDGSRPGA